MQQLKAWFLTRTSQIVTYSYIVPAISQTHKSLENSQDFFVKTKTKTKTLGLKTETKTKTLFFVFEAPRDQDFGLQDYITGTVEFLVRTDAFIAKS